MIKMILTIIIILAVLITIDCIVASHNEGLNSIPLTIWLLLILLSFIDFLKTYVNVNHDMSVEELCSLSQMSSPTYKRNNINGINIYNDTYDKFYRYHALQVHGMNVDYSARKILLPIAKYYYSDKGQEPKKIYTSKLFEVQLIATEGVVKYTEDNVYISKVSKDNEVICKNIIYNDLSKEVTVEYLGGKDKPVEKQTFVMEPFEVVVVEEDSVIKIA